MGIKRGMNPEEPQDFEDMMKDADQEMEANQTEDEIVERAPQLKQLSESIDNAATRLSDAEIEAKMRGHIRSVNQMFEEERKKVRERYREYDGIYLGYYAQWIGEFFFFIGVFVVLTVIIMLVGNSAGWFKL